MSIKTGNSKSITKLSLYIKAIKSMLGVGIFIGIFLMIFTIALYFTDSVLEFYIHVLLGIGEAIFIVCLFILIITPLPLNGIRFIKKQEEYFGIRFNDVMKTLNITEHNHTSTNWFVDVARTRVIALRRDYISSIGSVEYHLGGRGQFSQVMITAVDGNDYKIIGSRESIQRLCDWYC